MGAMSMRQVPFGYLYVGTHKFNFFFFLTQAALTSGIPFEKCFHVKWRVCLLLLIRVTSCVKSEYVSSLRWLLKPVFSVVYNDSETNTIRRKSFVFNSLIRYHSSILS